MKAEEERGEGGRDSHCDDCLCRGDSSPPDEMNDKTRVMAQLSLQLSREPPLLVLVELAVL
jgi:hypothetical protein